MTGDAEARNRANAYSAKALEYLASAQDSLAAGRPTTAAGDAIHSGIGAKDALATRLTGRTAKNQSHGAAVRELRTALGQREEAARALQGPRRTHCYEGRGRIGGKADQS